MQTKNTELPELDKVDIKLDYSLFHMAAAFFGVGLAASMPVLLCILHFRIILQGQGLKVLIITGVMCAVLTLVVAVVLFRLLFRAYHWQINEDGITMRSLLRRKHIDWRDVQDAWVEESSLGCRRLVLRTGKCTCMAVADSWRWVYPVVAASIRQHLERNGVRHKLGPVYEAETLWYEIPDALPDTLSWCGRMGWGSIIGMPVMAMAFLLMFFLGAAE